MSRLALLDYLRTLFSFEGLIFASNLSGLLWETFWYSLGVKGNGVINIVFGDKYVWIFAPMFALP